MKSDKEEYVDISDKNKNLNNVTPNKRGRTNITTFPYTSLGNKNSKTFDCSINNIRRIQNVSNSNLELNLTSRTVDLEKKNILNLSSDFVKKTKNSVFTNITNNQIKHKNNRNVSPEKEMKKSNSNNDIFVIRKEYSPLRYETRKRISFICNRSIYDLEDFISNDHLSSSQQLKSKSGIRLYMIFNDNKKVTHSQSLGCLGSKIKEGEKTYTNSEDNYKNLSFEGQTNDNGSNEKNETNCDENDEKEKKKQNDRLKAFEKILEEEKIEEQKKLKKLELFKMKEEEKKKKELERQLHEAKLKEEEERKIEEKLKWEEKIIKEQEEKLREEIKEQERKKKEEQIKAQEEERKLKLLETEKEIEAKLKRKYEEEDKKRKIEEKEERKKEEEKAKKREEELKKKMEEEIKNKERQFQIQLQKEIIKKEEEIKQKLKQEEEVNKRLHNEALIKKKLLEEEQNKLQKLEEELKKKEIEEKKKKEEDLKLISEQEELKKILKEKEQELQRKHQIEQELKDKLKKEEELRFQQIKKEIELKKQLAEEEEKRQKLLEEKIRRQKEEDNTNTNKERHNNKDESIQNINLEEINNIHYHKLIKLQQLNKRDNERNKKSKNKLNTYFSNFQQKSLYLNQTKYNSQQNINDSNYLLENFISEYFNKDNFDNQDLTGNKRNSTPILKKHFIYSIIPENKRCSEKKNNLSIKNKLQRKFISSLIPSLNIKKEQNYLGSKDFINSEDESSSDRIKNVHKSKLSIPNGKENEQIQEILTLSESKKDSNSFNDKNDNIIEEYSNKIKKKENLIYPNKINSFRQFSLSLPKNNDKYSQYKDNNSSRSKKANDNKIHEQTLNQNNNQSVLVEEKEQNEKPKKLNRNRSVGSLFQIESTIKDKVDFIPIENKLKKINVNYPIALQSSVKGKNNIINNKDNNFCYKYLNYNNLHNKDKLSQNIWHVPKEKSNIYSKRYIKSIFHKSKDKSYWMSFDQFNLKHKQNERFKNIESNKLNSFVKDRLKEHSIMPANKFVPICSSKPQSIFLY